jgi:hypothetical protein
MEAVARKIIALATGAAAQTNVVMFNALLTTTL